MGPIFTIADRYVDQSAALDPYGATMDGIAGHDEEATDYSPAGHAARAAIDRRTLAELDAIEPADEAERLARDVLRERLQAHLAVEDAGENYANLNVLHAPPALARMVFDLMSRESEGDWQVILRRLELIPGAIAGYRASLQEGIEKGNVSTGRQAGAHATQVETWGGNGDPAASYFGKMAASYGGKDSTLASALETAAAKAAAAYSGFGAYLRESYAPRAASTDGVGAERYQLFNRYNSGFELDLLETYAWGWEEVRRIRSETSATANLISTGAGLDEALRILQTDPYRVIEGEERYQAWLQDLHDRALDDLAGVHFDIPDKIRNIEVKIPPPGGALAPHYTPPSEDFSRPGCTWWPVGESKSFPTWDRPTIVYHEGVPGHHLQVGGVLCLGDKLSRFQRTTFIAGHGEGWALYSERLMHELGYLENPDYYLGLLASQALRAVRVVVDIGLHLGLELPESEPEHGGKTWTYDIAVDFATKNANQTEEFMRSEIMRYLGVPAQAISYKVGEREWLRARDSAKATLGSDFDLKAFHTAALELGPLPLAMLAPEINRVLTAK